MIDFGTNTQSMANGQLGLPQVSFLNDPTTGMFSAGAHYLAFSLYDSFQTTPTGAVELDLFDIGIDFPNGADVGNPNGAAMRWGGGLLQFQPGDGQNLRILTALGVDVVFSGSANQIDLNGAALVDAGDITVNGLTVTGTPAAPGASTANTGGVIDLAAGSHAGANDTTAGTNYYRSTALQGFVGFDGATTTVGGVAMAVGDFKWYVNGAYAGFVDISDTNRLVWAGAATFAGGVQINNTLNANSQAITSVASVSLVAGGEVGSVASNTNWNMRGGLRFTAGGGAAMSFYGVDSGLTGYVILYTPNAAGTADVQRWYVTGKAAIATSTWLNVNHDFGTGTALFGGAVTLPGGSVLVATTATLSNGAAGSVGTLTNAPAAGNPTKWIPINDGGVTRYIPAW